MFKVNEYKIVFKRVWHDRRRPLSKALRELKSVRVAENDGRYNTKCEIYVKDETMIGSGFRTVYKKEPSFTGIAKLHPNDKPDKIVGKKIALRNALKGCNYESYASADFYNKKTRAAIWKEFWKWVGSWNDQPTTSTTSCSSIGLPNCVT